MSTVLYLTSIVLTLLYIADTVFWTMGAGDPNIDIFLAAMLIFLVAKANEK